MSTGKFVLVIYLIRRLYALHLSEVCENIFGTAALIDVDWCVVVSLLHFALSLVVANSRSFG